MPTPYVPPQQPPVVPADVQQQQSQDQYQNSSSDINVEDKSNSSSDSQSQSESNVVQSPVNAQTNISNNNSDYFGFGVGYTRPVPTFYGHVTLDEYSEAVHLGFQIPIGGKTAKLSDEMIGNKIYAQKLSNATAEMSFCNSLNKQGIEINYSLLPLDHPAHRCDGLIINKTVVAQVPAQKPSVQLSQIRAEMQQLLKMNQQLQIQNQKLQRQLELKFQQNPFEHDGH